MGHVITLAPRPFPRLKARARSSSRAAAGSAAIQVHRTYGADTAMESSSLRARLMAQTKV
jgi:hypothetical protein